MIMSTMFSLTVMLKQNNNTIKQKVKAEKERQICAASLNIAI